MALSRCVQNKPEPLYNDHPELAKLVSNWEEIQVEAQQGDVLIKLAMYLTPAFKTANDKTKKLQDIEKNSDLAEVFERWKAQGNSDLALWGNHLNQHKKATLVEALLWRRFGNKILTDNAFESLQVLLETLQ
ncbi:hypothetical protein [Leptothoe spongobia]|uniref:Uncharacterized protein n=1 Tax=Leptothoe spongobia TAU-MAC 1115 TaxID=1967444 RepID=A0A947GQ66_9CYAN|nr:hypothetical protein [Leptothoe spongobia]MBT9316916.1 hypothetical protein [Leptothoe spongobia TAU-MAC 1115]